VEKIEDVLREGKEIEGKMVWIIGREIQVKGRESSQGERG
jgi:hypothetical protein